MRGGKQKEATQILIKRTDKEKEQRKKSNDMHAENQRKTLVMFLPFSI